MRSSSTFLVAASILSFAAATPLESRYYECTAPQMWYTCGDGWEGCCTVTPCKGPAEGVKSFCADDGAPSPPAPAPPVTEPPTPSEEPTLVFIPELTPSATPSATVDTAWMDYCKEDDSDCNWAPMFYSVKTDNETFTKNLTNQFYVRKDEGVDGTRRDSIALFTNIPDSVTRCSIKWYVTRGNISASWLTSYRYAPGQGIFYGVAGDGSLNISTLDLGDKTFGEAVGSEVSYESAKDLIAEQTTVSGLDLGNWGWTVGHAELDSGNEFDCAGSELALHFEMIAQWEGSVIVDQVSKKGQVNQFVQRAGWYLKYV
jgi:hypothetical protein